MAAAKTQIEASRNVDLNGVWVDGEKRAWADVFTRLSDEGMRRVREQREAASAEDERRAA